MSAFRVRFILMVIFCFSVQLVIPQSSITYKVAKGRFGDQLLAYCRAKWLALKYDFKLLYKPFLYSSDLVLDDCETRYAQTRFYYIKDENQIDLDRREDLVYQIDYFAKLNDWEHWEHFGMPLKKWPKFIEELKKMVCPKEFLKTIHPPEDMISVAVHIRKGGGFDTKPLLSEQEIVTQEANKHNYIDCDFPMKLPPDDYYIEQIKCISAMFNHQPLYLYIFTDDRDPMRLVHAYKKAVGLDNIVFACREHDNTHDKNVLKDFFSLANFDCLIRGDSSFSKAAQLLTNYQVIIFPEHATIYRDMIVIDQVNVVDNRNS